MKQQIAWAPNPGPQHHLVTCPVQDVLFGGARGGGKTYGFLGDIILRQKRYGKLFNALFVRRSYPELSEVLEKAHQLFPKAGAEWLAMKKTWVFPEGGWVRMAHLRDIQDAMRYQGHGYTAIYIDEAGQFPSPVPIDQLFASLRSGVGRVPKVMRLSANPGGPGHAWLKSRYVDPAPPFTVHEAEIPGVTGAYTQRVFIPSLITDNPQLMKHDPDYATRIAIATDHDHELRKAWLYGSWDIQAGGAFNDLWRPDAHVCEPFQIPASWQIDRSFDWGTSRPWVCLWWAESDGTSVDTPQGRKTYPPGHLFLVAERYGWTGKPDEGDRLTTPEICAEIKRIEDVMPWGSRVLDGPADPNIYTVYEGSSIGDVFAENGVGWIPGNNDPGVRITRVQAMRQRLKASLETPQEMPGITIFRTCRQWLRTTPDLLRDERNREDVEKGKQEDHCWDATGLRLVMERHEYSIGYGK